MTLVALPELEAVCNLQTSELSPLSLNYLRPSMQDCDHIVGGANIRDDKRLFRVTYKDEQLMRVDENGDLERLHDEPPIGPISTTAADHVDFRTIHGRVVRVPGQLVEFNPASPFEDYGRWVVCEKPTS